MIKRQEKKDPKRGLKEVGVYFSHRVCLKMTFVRAVSVSLVVSWPNCDSPRFFFMAI